MGYRPNPLVSALISERRRGNSGRQGSTLAFLTCFAERDGWRHSPNYVAIYDELRAHAGSRGYRVEEFWLTAPKMTHARMREILLNRGIRGIIVAPMPDSPGRLDFDFSDFAVIALGLTLGAPSLDRVSIDYYSVMSLCIKRLQAEGRRRIGFATTLSIDSRVNHLSLGAFLAERHLSPRSFVPPLTGEKWDMQAFLAWIDARSPDAVIAAITPDYFLFKDWLSTQRPAKSGDIRVVCVDCSSAQPRQSGVIQDLAAEARASVDWITSRVERAQFGVPPAPQTITVTGVWRNAQ